MKIFRVLIILILCLIIFAYISPISYAEYSTCTDEYHPPYGVYDDPCDTPLDWDSMFGEIELSDGSTVADIENEEYRLLYNEAAIISSPNYHNDLRDDIYLYEFVVSMHEDLTITSGTSNTIEFSSSELISDNYRDIEVDYMQALVKIPKGTSITFRIYNMDGELIDIIEMENDNMGTDMHKRLELIDVEDSNYSEEYELTVELERESPEHESPRIEDGVMLFEEAPAYRYTSDSFQRYPSFLSSYHKTMYENYKNEYHTNTVDEVYSPRLNEDMYSAYTVTNDIFGTSLIFDNPNTGTVTRHSYLEINKVEPSIKVPKENEVGNEWDTIIGDEGDIFIIYDAAIGDVPEDDKDFTGDEPDPDDGSGYSWSYNKEEIEFELEIIAQSLWETNTIDTITTSESGVQKISYDKEELGVGGMNDIDEIVVHKTMTAKYENVTTEHYWTFEPCPDEDDVLDDDDDESYSEASPDGCSSPDDVYPDEVNTRVDDREIIEFETDRYSDTMNVETFASNDGPEKNDNDFEIQIAQTQDESRIFVDIDENINSNRWSNILFSGVTRKGNIQVENNQFNEKVYIGSQQTINNRQSSVDEEREEKLDEKITEDMDVYLSIWSSGDFGSEPEINLEIEDNEIAIPSIESTNNRDELNTVINFMEISNFVHNKEEYINLNADINNIPEDISTQPKLEYMITIDMNEPIMETTSKWNNWFFRDSKWDGIENIDEDCGSALDRLIGDCFDYTSEPPESTGIIPAQAHLLPSANEIDSGINEGDIDVIEYSENEQTLNLPINSPNCSHHPDKDERICIVYNNSIYTDMDFDDIDGIEEDDIDYTPESTRARLMDTPHPNLFQAADEDEERTFKEPTKFEIKSSTPVQNISIAGNATWSDSDFNVNNIRNIQRTNLNVQIISKNRLTEEYIEDIEDDMLISHQLKTSDNLDDNEIQLRIELKDSNGEPINTAERDTDENIIVENSDIHFEGGDIVYINNDFDTNENGEAYVTIYLDDLDEDDLEDISIEFSAEEEWWKISEDIRLLETSNHDIPQIGNPYNERTEEVDNISFYDIISSVIFIFAIMFIVMAMMFRVYPNSNMTAIQLFYIITDSFRQQLKESIQYLILFLLFCFILLMFVYSGIPDVNTLTIDAFLG